MSEPATIYRLQEIERRLTDVEQLAKTVPVMARDVSAIAEDVREIADDQKSLRRALYTLALSISSGAVLFMFGVFEIFK